ncbi:MAG: hypothetical protein IM527_04670 [Microcystis sp. M42BS1]|nr:hypothetical protein [Microcystis sp. M42BS1]
MMYRVLHKLFGWDYIQFRDGSHCGISRVHVDGLGRPYYWYDKSIKLADFIRDPKKFVWLTCTPYKYFLSYNPKDE